MGDLISVIIPNRNGSATIRQCLQAVFSSDYEHFEIIVVDDCSADDSAEIIKLFPCRLITLEKHSGASVARNRGARTSKGQILFFTDADCLLQPDTLSRINEAMAVHGPGTVIGGTYTREPADPGFFSRFQSVFIHYSETRHAAHPDYVASHAMAVRRGAFMNSGGFPEAFLPIIEDVEYSHRLRRAGHRLLVDPGIQVRHIFGFDLRASLRNAVRKSTYWFIYSLRNRDLFADSGTASWELKINVACCFLIVALLAAAAVLEKQALLYPVLLLLGLNAFVSKGLIRDFRETGGKVFAFLAYGYYTLLYPFAVAAGVASGIVRVLVR
jgi:glycosyltransferase involved in cell wall biosynthesis